VATVCGSNQHHFLDERLIQITLRLERAIDGGTVIRVFASPEHTVQHVASAQATILIRRGDAPQFIEVVLEFLDHKILV
jgi:hypothetical protein